MGGEPFNRPIQPVAIVLARLGGQPLSGCLHHRHLDVGADCLKRNHSVGKAERFVHGGLAKLGEEGAGPVKWVVMA
jgi:hypothetical protein